MAIGCVSHAGIKNHMTRMPERRHYPCRTRYPLIDIIEVGSVIKVSVRARNPERRYLGQSRSFIYDSGGYKDWSSVQKDIAV